MYEKHYYSYFSGLKKYNKWSSGFVYIHYLRVKIIVEFSNHPSSPIVSSHIISKLNLRAIQMCLSIQMNN